MRPFLVAGVGTALLLIAADLHLGDDALRSHRNLGKAFYETPGMQSQAEAEFRKALDLAPESAREHVNYGLALLRAGKSDEGAAELHKAQTLDARIPHTWFNLGIAFKKDRDFASAAEQLQQMVKLVPADAVSHYNLGAVYKAQGQTETAQREFETASHLAPHLAGPHFQLYNAYRQAGRTQDAARELQVFQEIKQRNEGAAIPEDMEWNDYAEIYDARDPAPIHTDVVSAPKRAVPILGLPDVVTMSAGDFDNDGLADLCVIGKAGAYLFHNDKGRYRRLAAALPPGHYTKAVWLDYDHDYDLDQFLLGEKSVLMRNNGAAGFSDETARFPFVAGSALDAVPIDLIADTNGFDLAMSYKDRGGILYRDRLAGKFEAMPIDALPANAGKLVARDVNRDGWTDLAAGNLLLLNRRGSFERASADFTPREQPRPAHWLQVTLLGVKNLKLAANAKVEIKAGALYEKHTYEGAPLRFDLGEHGSVDTVRITWPNGLIQNEVKQAGNRAITIKEAPRLSGSCPMIFTWNGGRFEFITDVLGVAPLGASSGNGQYFPVDHDEYVWIPGESLTPRGGRYEVRITEELHEVSYLDQVRLMAVDHPRELEIFTNDKFKSPPYPEFRLFGVRKRIYPRRRTDRGSSVELDFGREAPANRAVLLLNGWVDWPDGSMFVNLAQQHREYALPSLQVKDAAGQWRTVIEDMGIPSGKPKTISVDLGGKFLSASREVRILTNLPVHWNDIFLAQDEAGGARMLDVHLESADLHFRGFSEYLSPVSFEYARVLPVSMWNPTAGNYTRYGDVRELMLQADDRMAVMGSGDELRLSFPAQLPPPPAGWKRDFLLLVDGWAKDGDPNTAFSLSVDPLPFHAMSQYPYKNGEHYPDDAERLEYLRAYHTRRAVRLVRSLAE